VTIKLPDDFIASLIPVYSQLTERGHLQSNSLQQLCTWLNDDANAGNISGTPVVEQLPVPSSHLFGCIQYREIFIPLRQILFLETATSHPIQIWRIGGCSTSVIDFGASNFLTEF
jgi:hypothetical protein